MIRYLKYNLLVTEAFGRRSIKHLAFIYLIRAKYNSKLYNFDIKKHSKILKISENTLKIITDGLLKDNFAYIKDNHLFIQSHKYLKKITYEHYERIHGIVEAKKMKYADCSYNIYIKDTDTFQSIIRRIRLFIIKSNLDKQKRAYSYRGKYAKCESSNKAGKDPAPLESLLGRSETRKRKAPVIGYRKISKLLGFNSLSSVHALIQKSVKEGEISIKHSTYKNKIGIGMCGLPRRFEIIKKIKKQYGIMGHLYNKGWKVYVHEGTEINFIHPSVQVIRSS